MVVTPSRVMETSLTIVLAEPPPPDPALPPADCEDDVSDVDDAADAADVVEAVEAGVVAAEGDDVTVALAEAIALIDMKTSPWTRYRASRRSRALSFNAAGGRSRRWICAPRPDRRA